MIKNNKTMNDSLNKNDDNNKGNKTTVSFFTIPVDKLALEKIISNSKSDPSNKNLRKLQGNYIQPFNRRNNLHQSYGYNR